MYVSQTNTPFYQGGRSINPHNTPVIVCPGLWMTPPKGRHSTVCNNPPNVNTVHPTISLTQNRVDDLFIMSLFQQYFNNNYNAHKNLNVQM